MRALEVLEEQERAGNKNVRSIRKHRVSNYARQMSKGQWHVNGETICFNGSKMQNGQHRLKAIIASETTQWILTVRGVSDAAVVSIDTGINRTAADYIGSSCVAAAARICYLYLTTGELRSDPDKIPSHEDLVSYVQEHSSIVESAAWAREIRSLGSPSALAAWHHLCGEARPVERDIFFQDLAAGTGLKSGQPVLVLREALIRARSGRLRFPSFMISAYIIKAWNAELEGRRLGILRLTADERFPELRR